MTRIVYAAPDISPDVWRPMPGDIVLPLSEHPTIIEEGRTERLPGEPTRAPRRKQSTQVSMLFKYLREHPPADVYAIADALDLNWENVKRVLSNHPRLFRVVEKVRAGKYKHMRAIWGLVGDSQSTPTDS